jgi:YbbR domain-containing protein
LEGESASVRPQWTTIRGAASVVDGVSSVPTAPLDLGRIRSSGERVLALEFDRTRFVCDPAKVTVSIVVAEKSRRVLANVPPTVLVDSEDYIARVFPRTVSLTLEGAAGVLDTLSSGDVSVLLDLSGRSPDEYRLAPEVILPPGVALVGMSADTLEVQISRGGSANAP